MDLKRFSGFFIVALRSRRTHRFIVPYFPKEQKLVKETPNYAGDEQRVYLEWIENYASDEYQNSIRELRLEIDQKHAEASDRERNKFRKNFSTGLKFEYNFLESVYNLSEDSI